MPKVNVKKGSVVIGSASKRDLKTVRLGDEANPINLSRADAERLIARGVVEPAEGQGAKKAAAAEGQGGGEGEFGTGSNGEGGQGNPA